MINLQKYVCFVLSAFWMSHNRAHFNGSVYNCTGVTNGVTDDRGTLQGKAYP